MTLRTRLIFLIVGSAVIPPLMVFTAVVVGFANTTPLPGVQGFVFVQRLLRGDLEALPTVQGVQERLLERDPIGDLYLLDADSQVLYPPDRAGETTDIEALAEPADQSRSSTVIPLADERGGSGYLVAINPVRSLPDRLSGLGLAVPLVFVIVTAAGSVLVIRSINRSVQKLEEATRRIAEGDLDFDLDPGSGRDRIAAVTRSFDQMRLQLKDQYDRGSRFLMGISHDLKTPLASISGYLDAIADGFADSPEKLERYMSIVRTKTQLLESRISALIDYAKQETRDWKATLRPVRLKRFLNEFVSLVEAEAAARHHGFSSSIRVGPTVTVLMDQDMVTRALENLVANAFAYASEGSPIRIAARCREGACLIEVANEGAGISDTDLPHVFDPLYRASAARSGVGFGLGLAVVKAVITSHGWQVRAESDPGATTVFTVTIPLVDAEPAVRAIPDS